jgi:hypothetical protein
MEKKFFSKFKMADFFSRWSTKINKTDITLEVSHFFQIYFLRLFSFFKAKKLWKNITDCN